ncbi:MAG: response regulator [Minwuia sp.]|nr:response regulator [Minwuia sp.]
MQAMRVLIVDDSDANRKVARVFLEREGHVVVEANGGAAGLRELASNDVDIILMDIAMPEIDGLEATRQIRRMGGSVARTPIVAWTAHDVPGMRLQCAAAGMDGYLTKPIQRTPLVENLTAVLQRSRTERDQAAVGC